jgi:hypothetical protein
MLAACEIMQHSSAIRLGMWEGEVARNLADIESRVHQPTREALSAIAALWCWADYRHRRGFTNDFPALFGAFGVVTFDRKPKRRSPR